MSRQSTTMNLIRRIRPQKTGLRAPLGELELTVMRHVWECAGAGCLAADVQESLARERSLALTTVLTTLDRLFDKGILLRERDGRAYRYRAALSEEQLQHRIVEGILGDLVAQFPNAVAAYFAGQEPAHPSVRGENSAALETLAERLRTARTDREAEENAADD